MAHAVARGADRVFEPEADGFSSAIMAGAGTGSIHLEVSLCRLEPGASTPATFHSFEDSWYVLEGVGQVSVAEITYDVGPDAYGVFPVAVPRQLRAGPSGLQWLRTRAPQPRTEAMRAGLPADDWQPATKPRRPSETDPRSRWAGQFTEADIGPYGPLAMPGYHGPNVQNIFVRMLVDELIGAQQHTLFTVEFGPQAKGGKAASEHYHPFEETYFLTAGSATGTLDGEQVEVTAGDLVWTSVNGTHGFVNSGDVPVRWLEVQSPTPPTANGFCFLRDWDGRA